MINPLVDQLAEHTSIKTACELLGRPRGSHYRAKAPRSPQAPEAAAGTAQRAERT